jgi:hypothetical protein
MINIVTSFFISKLSRPNIAERNAELVTALQRNVESPTVESIHLFIDDESSLSKLPEVFAPALASGKIVVASKGKQPLYADLFQYANDTLNGKICMVTNSDIYIHSCESRLLDNLLGRSVMYALTRHEYDMSCPLINDYHGSHDSFIFQSPLKISVEGLRFPQNVWGSENKLLAIIYNQNIQILNPCRQIQIVHLHKSQIREENRIWISCHKKENKEVHHPPTIL